ncbi:MAG: polysaccharide deacetylase family protein [Oligoflexia bacterium]|nr:polysaccharide deacetylase family protein [Oligoflexia bacterium]
MQKPRGLLTFDVEDWEHANFRQLDSADVRASVAESVRERRYAMDRNTDAWIGLLGTAGARSTCFVLGEFAERYPDAVRRLQAAGHEIATHGASHDLIYRMSRTEFREYLRRGIGQVAELTGQAPKGFRAPSWSVDPVRTPWLCEELELQGIQYDSSVFPVKTPLFGERDSPLRPYREGKILRVPVTVLTLAGLRLPFSSGAFFRLAPLAMIRWGLRRAVRLRLPLMVVLHPRELDPAHPRLPLKGWERSVHYARLESTVPKLTSLLGEFRWSGILEELASLERGTRESPSSNSPA